MLRDEEDHVIHCLDDVLFSLYFFARFEDGLNGLRASAGASPTDTRGPAPMVGPQLTARRIEYCLAHLSAQRCFHDIDGSGDREGGVLPFQKINDGFPFRRNSLARAIESASFAKPDGVGVRTHDAAPDSLLLGVFKCIGRLDTAFD